jgi:hypothetical protein
MKGAISSLLASALVLSLGVRTAQADKPKKVVIEQFSGTASDQFKKLVAGAVAKQGIEVVSDKKRAATEADLGLLQVSDNYAAVAKELGVGAFIDGTVTGSKHLTARLKVKGPDGAALGSASWTGANAKKLLNNIDDTVAKKVAGILSGGGAAKEEAAPAAEAKEEAVAEEAPKPKKKKAAAPAADEEKPAKSEEEASVSASASKEDDETPSGPPSPFTRFDLAAGAHVYGRNFSYNKSITGGQQAYRLPAVPAPTIQADVFFTKNIGISGSFEYSVALISQDKAGFRYTTSSMGWAIGAKYRLFLGATELVPGLAYSSYSFKVTPEDGDATPPQVAAVDYKQLKIGAGVRIPVSDKFALVGGGNYLHLLGMGELRDNYFPFATGRGGEGYAGIAFALPWAAGLEGRLSADFRRYVFDMHSDGRPPKPDPRQAGGAVDQYVGANIMFAFRK